MRTKRIAQNAIVEIIFYLTIGILGIFKVKYIIEGLGSELNGYYQFINQIIAYLFLVEAGLSSAIVFKFYKPLANNDEIKAAELFNGARVIFRRIALIISGIMLAFAVGLYFYFGETEFNFSLVLMFVILVSSQLIPYFFYSKSYSALLAADQKRYISSIIFNAVRLVTDLLIIYVVITFKSIVVLALVSLSLKVIQEVIVIAICKRRYSWLKRTKEKDTSAKKMTGDLIWHQVGTLAVNNIDSIILMTFLGPIMVSIYSTYNYIIFFLKQLISRVNSGIVNALGNVFAKEKTEKSLKLFKEYQSLMMIIALVVGLTFNISARAFINIWIAKSNYILEYYVIVIFSSTIFLSIIYSPLSSAIRTNGLYKESKYFALILAVINVGLSILLLQFYGIAGILLATSICFIIGMVLRARLIATRIFINGKFQKTLVKYVISIAIFVSASIGIGYIEMFFYNKIINLFQWILLSGVSFIVFGLSITGLSLLIDKNTKDIIKKIIFLLRKKQNKEIENE